MNLTTKERVKATLGDGTTNLDAKIEQLIASGSYVFERYLRRVVKTATSTDTVRIYTGVRQLLLPRYPVTTLTSLVYDGITLVSGADYDYELDAAAGVVYLNTVYPPSLSRMVATYTGGMAGTVGEFVGLYPDIAHALDQQVMHWLAMGANPAAVNSSSRRGNFAVGVDLTIIPMAKEILDSYRRYPRGAI